MPSQEKRAQRLIDKDEPVEYQWNKRSNGEYDNDHDHDDDDNDSNVLV